MTEKFGAIHVDNFVCTSGTSEVVVKVSGLTTIARSGITITGDILADNITSTGNLGVSGTTTLAGVSTVNNNLNVSGLFVQNNATITGDVFISGDLTVTGTITGTVETAENLNVVANSSNLDRFPVFSTVTAGVSLPYVDGDFKYNPSQNRLTIANLVATQSGNFGGNGIVSSGNIICGPQTGSVALTLNDGYGNANIAFNHTAGKPDQVGNALRIKTNVDGTSNPTMEFQGAVASSAGSATSLSNLFRLRETEGADFPGHVTANAGNFIIGSDGFGITWDDSGDDAARVYADRSSTTFNIDLNSVGSMDINTFKIRENNGMGVFNDLLSLDDNALTVTKVIAQELERSGGITIDANGAGADITLSAADHVILNSGSEEDGAIYFRGKSGVDSYRFAKSGQTAIEGFLSFESLSADRTFTFPNTTGTVALTSDLSSYAEKSGATFTGELQINARLDVGDGSDGNHEIRIYKGDNNVSDHIQFYNGTTRMGEIGCEDTNWLRINQETDINIFTPRYIRADGGLFVNGLTRGINGDGEFLVGPGSRTDLGLKFGNDEDTGMYRVGSNSLALVTGGNVRTVIASNGNQKHSAIGNPTRAHEFKTSRGGSNSYFIISGYNSATVNDASGGTEVFRVRSNGGVQNTANVYTSLSDERLKENIVDAQSQWDDVKALRLVNFNFRDEVGYGSEKLLGFIAQEVEEICPQLVDSDDLDDEESFVPGQKSVRNSIIMTKAFGALQEAMTRIEQLEARIAQLEGSEP
tara:strand:+ start:3171 stop:5441 length:2271 start_codon:yes stop_codon:yes gene_type:complete